jgi:hypothetical protein
MPDKVLVDMVLAAGSAVAAEPVSPATTDDYQTLHAALSSSARGREFLAEFAGRNRHADTEMLLAALDRLEARMRADGTAHERLRDELRMLLIAIRLTRPDIDAASAPDKAEKLVALLDMLASRIDAMVARGASDDAAPAEAPSSPAAVLSLVPISDEPELPIPAPTAPPREIALVRSAVAMPEVTFIGGAPLGPKVVEHVDIEMPAPAPIPLPAMAKLPALDPLAPIKALSEFERIALFT